MVLELTLVENSERFQRGVEILLDTIAEQEIKNFRDKS